jgi:hypothetical protein
VTIADFDLTATAGRVMGSITANGVPLPAYIRLDRVCGGIQADDEGVFVRLLSPGTYAAPA